MILNALTVLVQKILPLISRAMSAKSEQEDEIKAECAKAVGEFLTTVGLMPSVLAANNAEAQEALRKAFHGGETEE